MKIVYEVSKKEIVDEIYVTLFDNTTKRKRLISFLENEDSNILVIKMIKN